MKNVVQLVPSQAICYFPGDIEISFGLKTYLQNVISCCARTELYVLNLRNYDRLIARRNGATLDMLRNGAMTKLKSRLNSPHGAYLPLFKRLMGKLESPELQGAAKKSQVMAPSTSSLELNPHRGAIIDFYGPGTVFYRNRKRAIVKETIKDRSKFRGHQSGAALKYGVSSTHKPRNDTKDRKPLLKNIKENETKEAEVTVPTQVQRESLDDDAAGQVEGLFHDFSTSDRALSVLEDRIRSWHAAIHANHGTTGRNTMHLKSLIRLKRVHIDVSDFSLKYQQIW